MVFINKDTARRKTVVLKAAQEERRTSGRVIITLSVVDAAAAVGAHADR